MYPNAQKTVLRGSLSGFRMAEDPLSGFLKALFIQSLYEVG